MSEEEPTSYEDLSMRGWAGASNAKVLVYCQEPRSGPDCPHRDATSSSHHGRRAGYIHEDAPRKTSRARYSRTRGQHHVPGYAKKMITTLRVSGRRPSSLRASPSGSLR